MTKPAQQGVTHRSGAAHFTIFEMFSTNFADQPWGGPESLQTQNRSIPEHTRIVKASARDAHSRPTDGSLVGKPDSVSSVVSLVTRYTVLSLCDTLLILEVLFPWLHILVCVHSSACQTKSQKLDSFSKTKKQAVCNSPETPLGTKH